jgi:hypothetical protein
MPVFFFSESLLATLVSSAINFDKDQEDDDPYPYHKAGGSSDGQSKGDPRCFP